MARGEGSEQYAPSLLPVKPTQTEGSAAKPTDQRNRLSVCSKLCYAIGGAPYQITGTALGFFLQIYLLDVAQPKDQRNRLSLCSTLCFAMGGAPYQLTQRTLTFFLQIYLLDVAQVDPSYASIILFTGKAWDAVTDPSVGFLVSRTRWTCMGRLKPWMVFSTPFVVLTYILIWYVPPFEGGKFIWYMIFYCLFQLMQTCFYVPYSALTMFISSEQRERDSATAYRIMVEVLATLLGTAIQGQIVSRSSHCSNESEVFEIRNSSDTSNLSSVSLEETKQLYLISAGVISGLYVLCTVIMVLGVKELKGSRSKKSEPLPCHQSLWLMMSHTPYVTLVFSYLFTCFAYMLLQGNAALYYIYATGHRNHFQNILLVMLMSATLSIPFWLWFSNRYGKKMAMYCSIPFAMPFFLINVFVENLIFTHLSSGAAGVSFSASYFLFWSMLPDAVDDFKVKNPDVHDLEALFYSFFVFFTKLAAGLALSFSSLSLKFAGYVIGSCSQPEAVSFSLKILISPVPLCLIAVGMLILWTYPINKKTSQTNQKRLQEILDSEAALALGSNV